MDTTIMMNATRTPEQLEHTYTDLEKQELIQQLNDDMARLMTPATVYISVLMVLGLFGNSTVCYYYTFKIKRTVSSLFIVILAVYDVIVCAVSMPTEIVDIVLFYTFENSPACKILRFVNYLAGIGSILTLIAIATDRYKKICKAVHPQMTVPRAKVIVAIVFLASVLLSWPSLLIYGAIKVNIPNDLGIDLLGSDCTSTKEQNYRKYVWSFNVVHFVLFFICSVTLIVLYSIIGKTIYVHRKRLMKYKMPRTSIKTTEETCLSTTPSSKVETDVATTPSSKVETDVATAPSSKVETDVATAPSSKVETDVATTPSSKVETDVATTPSSKVETDVATTPSSKLDIDVATTPSSKLDTAVATTPSSKLDTEVATTPSSKVETDVATTPRSKLETEVATTPSSKLDTDVATSDQGGTKAEYNRKENETIEDKPACKRMKDTTCSTSTQKTPDSSHVAQIDRRSGQEDKDAIDKGGMNKGDINKGAINRRTGHGDNGAIDKGSIDKETIKLTFIMITVTTVFIVSFLPYLSLTIWRVYQGQHEAEFLSGGGLVGFKIGSRSFLLNSSLNPWIYGIFNTNFRRFVLRPCCSNK